ncbi:MAG: Sec-independent protein translocase subunit TatA/TatB [Candidatus Dormibacteria bacterium]|jgi:sec-independent protein translocase protein TatA
MFSDHWLYLIILLMIALVVFGPKRLPELGQSLGKAINEFRSATQSVTHGAGSATTLSQTPAQPSAPIASNQAPTPSAEVAVEPGTSEPVG